MIRDRPAGEPRRIGFLLLPRFSMMCLLSAVEPLRAANRTLGREAYVWRFLSPDGRPVAASNGIPIAAAAGVDDPAAADLPATCVVASYAPLAGVGPELLAWLRQRYRAGCDLGGLETGATVLAEAGLLGGRRATVHWETLAAFSEAHLEVDARDSLYEIDGPFFTASGAGAAMDLFLHLIARHHATTVATSVAEQFLHSEIRDAGAGQRMAGDRRLGVHDPALARIIATMRDNLAFPLSLAELAVRCGVSRRRLQRLFDRHVGAPPKRYYLRLRLERARELLRHGELPVHEIALACGFGSVAAFSRAYRARYGHPPRAERDMRDRAARAVPGPQGV